MVSVQCIYCLGWFPSHVKCPSCNNPAIKDGKWVIKSLKTNKTFVSDNATLNWCMAEENVKTFNTKAAAEHHIKINGLETVEVIQRV